MKLSLAGRGDHTSPSYNIVVTPLLMHVNAHGVCLLGAFRFVKGSGDDFRRLQLDFNVLTTPAIAVGVCVGEDDVLATESLFNPLLT